MKCWISERKVKWNEVSMDEKLTSEWVYFGGGKDSWQLDYEEAVAYRFCLSRWVHFLSNSRLSLKTKSWLCFTPVTRTTRRIRTRRTAPHQNLELSKPQPNLNTMVGFDKKMTLQTTPPHHTNSVLAISQLLLTRFWPNFKRRLLRTSRTDSNCYGDICPGNICSGDICPYQEYLSCCWLDFDQSL